MKRLSLIFVVLLLVACSANKAHDLWIYTSIPPEHIAAFDKIIKERFPTQNLRWYQAGSENIAARLAMEMASNSVQADLVMTGDYFWYMRLQGKGFWHDYKPHLAYESPPALSGTNWPFSVMRYTAMVIVYNREAVAATEVPKSFADIVEPRFKAKISTGNPLESGTSLVLMNNLAFRYGYDFIKKMRENDVMVAGSNSNTLARLVSAERPIALMLLEHALKEKEKNPKIEIVYPNDGAVIIPAPIAIVQQTRHEQAAKQLYDFFMSDEAQKISVEFFAHATNPNIAPPKGAKETATLLSNAFALDTPFLDFVRLEEESFKNKFSQIIFE